MGEMEKSACVCFRMNTCFTQYVYTHTLTLYVSAYFQQHTVDECNIIICTLCTVCAHAYSREYVYVCDKQKILYKVDIQLYGKQSQEKYYTYKVY